MSDRIEENIRKKLQNFEVPFEESAWKKMEAKITADKSNRRKVSAIWLLIALFSITLNGILIGSLMQEEKTELALHEQVDENSVGLDFSKEKGSVKIERNAQTLEIGTTTERAEVNLLEGNTIDGYVSNNSRDLKSQAKNDLNTAGVNFSENRQTAAEEPAQTENPKKDLIDQQNIGAGNTIDGIASVNSGIRERSVLSKSEEDEEQAILGTSESLPTGRPLSSASKEKQAANSTKRETTSDILPQESVEEPSSSLNSENGKAETLLTTRALESNAETDEAHEGAKLNSDTNTKKAKEPIFATPLSLSPGLYFGQSLIAVADREGSSNTEIGCMLQVGSGLFGLKAGLGYEGYSFRENFMSASPAFLQTSKPTEPRTNTIKDILVNYQVDFHSVALPLAFVVKPMMGSRIRPFLSAGGTVQRSLFSEVLYHYDPSPIIIFEREPYTTTVSPEELETAGKNYWLVSWDLSLGLEYELEKTLIHLELHSSKVFAGSAPEELPGSIGLRASLFLKD